MARPVTKKQQEVLEYLRDYIERHGVWPTYREIMDAFAFNSPNSVTQNLTALSKKGHLRRDDNGFHLVGSEAPEGSVIPVRGVIAAGALHEAIDNHLGTISLETLFPNLDRIYAIRVSGQSMVGENIQDGDYVLLVDDDIPNGGIGAVLYNGETSLKRIYADAQGLRLEPASPEYENIEIYPGIFEEVRVLGRYVGHVSPRHSIFRHT